jgi:hypothetical protein
MDRRTMAPRSSCPRINPIRWATFQHHPPVDDVFSAFSPSSPQRPSTVGGARLHVDEEDGAFASLLIPHHAPPRTISPQVRFPAG